MKIRTKIKLACAAMGTLTIAAAVLGTILVFHFTERGERNLLVGWPLAGCLLGILLLVSHIERLRDREDAGAVKCDCGGVLLHVKSADTPTESIGKCNKCGQHYAVPKRLGGNSDGGREDETG
jgi:hypothetical protein